MKSKVYPIDTYDKEGNLTGVEFMDCLTHEFQIQALWDPNDEQTQENRITFRKWANNMLKNMGYEVII
jgi:hypothetical protein